MIPRTASPSARSVLVEDEEEVDAAVEARGEEALCTSDFIGSTMPLVKHSTTDTTAVLNNINRATTLTAILTRSVLLKMLKGNGATKMSDVVRSSGMVRWLEGLVGNTHFSPSVSFFSHGKAWKVQVSQLIMVNNIHLI